MANNAAPTAEDTQSTGWTLEQAAQAFLEADSDHSEQPTPNDAAPDATVSPTESEPDAEITEAQADEIDAAEQSDEAEQEATTEPPQPRKVRVKLDDAEEEVTEDELVKGYQRQSDYTRKTQQLSEQRKAFEAEQTAVREERQRYATYLTELEQALRPAEPDWNTLRQQLPADQFAAAVADYQLAEKQHHAVRAEQERAAQQVQRDQLEQRAKLLQAEQAKLLEKIPELADPEKGKARLESLTSYAKTTYGWTEQDLANVTDHRLLLLLDKARAYDELQRAKPKVQQRIEQKVRTATPGAAASVKQPVSDLTRAKMSHAKLGTVQSAAAIFEQLEPD